MAQFGLQEGSSRVHPGQGTVNRKFYFEDFFLEILWVHDEAEIKSETTAKTQLWSRSQYASNDHSPFGLCLVNTPDTDELFKNALRYQPNYFPEGMAIDFIPNSDQPFLPWTFRLPFKGAKQASEEPTDHQVFLQKLTKANFTIPKNNHSRFLQYFTDEQQINFTTAGSLQLHLEFDHGKQQQEQYFKALNLRISY